MKTMECKSWFSVFCDSEKLHLWKPLLLKLSRIGACPHPSGHAMSCGSRVSKEDKKETYLCRVGAQRSRQRRSGKVSEKTVTLKRPISQDKHGSGQCILASEKKKCQDNPFYFWGLFINSSTLNHSLLDVWSATPCFQQAVAEIYSIGCSVGGKVGKEGVWIDFQVICGERIKKSI